MLEIKNTVTEMSRVSAGLISRVDAAKKSSVSLDKSTEKSQNKKKKKWEKRTEYPILWDNYKRCNICVIGTPEAKKEEIFENIMAKNFP